jgi:hypothetical protein
MGVAVDTSGNIFIADQFNHRIRRVDVTTGFISTVAGNGTGSFSGDGGLATSASLAFPSGVAVDATGNIFIADQDNHRIRRVDAATGIISTVAGNGTADSSGDGGPATSASLNRPARVALDAAGSLFIADQFNQSIRRVDAATGFISTVAGIGSCCFNGDNIPATSARLGNPFGVAVDTAGNIFIADSSNSRIRRVDATTGIITTAAGNGVFGFSGDGGPATSASISVPLDVAVDTAGNFFLVDEFNHRIRRVILVTTVSIDIKPGSDSNAVAPADSGLIPVAILSTDTFDATTISPSTVKFGSGEASMAHTSAHLEDVDNDSDLDLMLHFLTQQAGIQCGDTDASLTGQTFDGEPIQGSDGIITVGCS